MGASEKLYISQSEHYGSARHQQSTAGKYKNLPVNACCLSLQPAAELVSTRSGHLFDRDNLMEWQRINGQLDPVDGKSLDEKSLIPVKFHRNSAGELQCPVTLKSFNSDTSRIVLIASSGNVFSWEAVDRLNVQNQNWKELLTGEPFTRNDIIILQDPKLKPELRDVSKFHYVNTKKIKSATTDKFVNSHPVDDEVATKIRIGSNTMASRILKEYAQSSSDSKSTLDSVKYKPIAVRDKSSNPYNAAHYSQGRVAASLTSTSMSIVTQNEAALIDEHEFMFKQIKKSAFVQLKTNYGDVNLELYASLAPRTCYNFVALARKGYYNDSQFHRNIKNFMIQGGDPTATGKGGESVWGKDFIDEFKSNLSHNARGILSMANRGPNTNGSQFFITYKPCKHLDRKHTVFGKVLGEGLKTLDVMESVPVDSLDRPVRDIKILQVMIMTDPFEEFESNLAKQEEKKRKRTDDPGPAVHVEETTNAASSIAVGKYLASVKSTTPMPPQSQSSHQQVKKPKPTGKLSDFSAW